MRMRRRSREARESKANFVCAWVRPPSRTWSTIVTAEILTQGRCAGRLRRGGWQWLMFWDNEAFGRLRAVAEEKLLHLLFHDFLRVGVHGIEAEFVEQHLGMVHPHFPGILGDVFVNALANFALPGNAVEPGQLFSEFHALHHANLLPFIG